MIKIKKLKKEKDKLNNCAEIKSVTNYVVKSRTEKKDRKSKNKMKLNCFIFFAIVISSTLISCGKDLYISKTKLLESITENDGRYSLFEYDNKNRISKVNYYNNNGEIIKRDTHNYNGDTLVISTMYSNYCCIEDEYIKNGNTIERKKRDGPTTSHFPLYTIDNNGYIIKSSDYPDPDYDYHVEEIFHYQGGNLTKITIIITKYLEVLEYVIELIYDNKKSPLSHCKTPKWVLFFYPYTSYVEGISKGFKNNNIVFIYNEQISEIEYDYDIDGYPTNQYVYGSLLRSFKYKDSNSF